MRFTALLIALVVSVAGCRGIRPAPAPAEAVGTPADTADVLEAVWHVPIHPFTSAGVRWLHLPEADSAALTASETVRETLRQRGIPATARHPMGHDTVVYRVSRWTRDSTGDPILTLDSFWTHMSTSAPAICMSGGNRENYHAHRAQAGWEAERIGRVLHGDGYCDPNGRRR